MRRFLLPLAVVAVALAVVAPATAKPTASVTIRHQIKGCHTWSVNGGAYAARHTLHAKRGTVLTIRNLDVMPHQLVQQGGPRVAFSNLRAPAHAMGLKGPYKAGEMARMGAATRLVLAKPGTYRFTTRGGEDYTEGVKTVGEDNVLELTIVVS
jgi:hypothetical protein